MVDMVQFEKDLAADLQAGREAFERKYKTELDQLMGLSHAEIDAITPGAADLQAYAQLIAVVKQASRHNLEQQALASRVRALGDVAVTIAKKSASLAAILA